MQRLNGKDRKPPERPSRALTALLQVLQWGVRTIDAAAKSLVIAAVLFWLLFLTRLAISGIDPMCR